MIQEYFKYLGLILLKKDQKKNKIKQFKRILKRWYVVKNNDIPERYWEKQKEIMIER
jgi:hypothetical protein